MPKRMLNAFDAAPGRTVEVKAGDLFALRINVDLLVISAKENIYEKVPGTMVKVLHDRCGLDVGELRLNPDLDLTGSPTIRGWVSPLLEASAHPPSWPDGSQTQFRRLAVLESPQIPLNERDGLIFQQLFRLLALLPLHGIHCNSIATPLLNTGEQQELPESLYPAILEAIDNGFRHVSDLQRFIIFDLKEEALQSLCAQINETLRRSPLQKEVLTVKPKYRDLLADLAMKLQHFQRKHHETLIHKDIQSTLAALLDELQGEQITVVTLGFQARKLLESLVNQALRPRKLDQQAASLSLFQKVKLLSDSTSAWSANAIHTVRTFGNWMCHATPDFEEEAVPRRNVTPDDMLAMILAMQRVLDDYPWPSRQRHQRRRRRRRNRNGQHILLHNSSKDSLG